MSGFGYFLFGLATGFVLACFAVALGMFYQAVTKSLSRAMRLEATPPKTETG